MPPDRSAPLPWERPQTGPTPGSLEGAYAASRPDPPSASKLAELASGAALARFGRWAGPLAFLLIALAPTLRIDGLLLLDGLPQPARLCAAAVAWTALWWLTEALPIGAASLLPAVLLPLLGVLGAGAVAQAYWNDLILLFLGAFLLALMIERWNLHRRVALRIAARVGGQPRRLVLGFLLAAALSSMWLNNTACALMLLPIGEAVIQAVEPGGPRRSSFATALLLALAFGCTLGGLLTPVGTAPNQVLLGLLSERLPERPELGFGAWMVATLPIGLLAVPFAWWLLTRAALKVGAGGAAGAAVLEAERARLGPLQAPELRAGLLFIAAVLLWILRSDLDLGLFAIPGWEGLFPGLELSNASVALAIAIAAFLLPSGAPRGGALLDWDVARKLPLDVLLLLGGGFALAEGISASGLDSHLAQGLAPLLMGLPSPLAVLLLVFVVAALTELTSNTATVQVVLPLLLSAALTAGVDPLRWMLPATLAASCAFMLPVGTPPNAVVFGSGRLEIAQMARVGLWMHLALVLLIALVCELWVVPRLAPGP